MTRFKEVIDWKRKRGITGGNDLMGQYSKVVEEIEEIEDAILRNDRAALIDALGDSVVTLINLADAAGLTLEGCLDAAFNEIRYRKGLLDPDTGLFVRYAKLSDEDKGLCDLLQGCPGKEHVTPEIYKRLKPENFTKGV